MKILKIALIALFGVSALQASQIPEANTGNNGEVPLTTAERLGHFAIGCGKAVIAASVIVVPFYAAKYFGFIRESRERNESGQNLLKFRLKPKMHPSVTYPALALALLAWARGIWGAKAAAASARESFRKALST